MELNAHQRIKICITQQIIIGKSFYEVNENLKHLICKRGAGNLPEYWYPKFFTPCLNFFFSKYFLAHLSTSYFTCSDGNFILQNCPGSLWFNPVNQFCDFPQNVNCPHAPPTTTTTVSTTTSTTLPTTTSTTLSTTTQIPTEIVCPSSGVSRIPNPFSCTRYFLCFDGVPVERVCSSGLYFSRSLLRCVRREDSDCDLETKLCPDINDPNNIIFLANQEDCQRYFICYDGEPTEMDCGPRLHWDPVNNWCIRAENSTCVPSFVLPEIREIDCPMESAHNLLFLPHPEDCRFYFTCFQMRSLLQRCQNRTLFDYIIGACRLADQAQCYA